MRTFQLARLVGGAVAVLMAFLTPISQADLFVGSQTPNQILHYNGVTGTFIDSSGSVGGDMLGMTFGPDGNLYACSGNILRYDGKSGKSLGVFASGGGMEAPINLTFGPDGNLYV